MPTLMRFRSTRDTTAEVGFVDAITHGLAGDGGLYVPTVWPEQPVPSGLCLPLPKFAQDLLTPFVTGTAIVPSLQQLCQRSFDFPIPLRPLGNTHHVLELFHGPTLSFKDIGASFLAGCLAKLDTRFTVLVATSGDTGSAVASGCFNLPGIRVVVLFPHGRISRRQQAQITCWGHNVTAIAVEGDFDDCQRLVKQAFSIAKTHPNTLRILTTANSINIGRLLPQMVYYAYSACQWQRRLGELMPVVVPSGNVGNVTACFYAKRMGFPIGNVHIATNANRGLFRYWQTGERQPIAAVPTLANAMDVGLPSNLERLIDMFPEHRQFHEAMTVSVVDDDTIRQSIADAYEHHDYLLCPHTATAYAVAQQLGYPCCMVATAHPAKFEAVIEPIVNQQIPLPQSLTQGLANATLPVVIPPSDAALQPYLV